MNTATDYPYSTRDLAAKLGCHPTTARNRAKALGVGIDLQGAAGLRFSDADVQALIESLRPVAVEKPKRRRRRTRGAAA